MLLNFRAVSSKMYDRTQATSERPQVRLIPWDPESDDHIKRIYDQRIACGWKSDEIESWRPLQREGKMTIQWVVLPPSSANTATLLATHTARYPIESTQIFDSATSFGGEPRNPDPMKSFIPVGHISLDTVNPYSLELADPTRGIYCISTFYISSPLQSAGIGRATMDVIERTASDAPINAKVLALNTLAKEQYLRLDMWEALDMPVPKVATQEWYERRGYQAFDWHEKGFKHVDKKGREWWLKDVFMRKDVV